MSTAQIQVVDYISKEQIVFLGEEKNREEALQRLVACAYQRGVLPDEDHFYQAILQREARVSTGLGMGIAIPHAKLEEVDDFFLIVGIYQGEGIDWDAIDGLNVRLIFLIGGPQSVHKEYLQLLSELTQILKDEKQRQLLLAAKNQDSVVNIFQTC